MSEKKDATKEARRVKIPVTKLQTLYLAVADLCDSGVVKEAIDTLAAEPEAVQLKDFFTEVEKAYDSVYQTHWGGEVYAEAVKTTEFLLAAEQPIIDALAAEEAANNDEGQLAPAGAQDGDGLEVVGGKPPEQA